MKLQILVPQWKEDESIIKNLLNSIEVQQGVDLNEIGVIIMNDGSDIILSDDFLNKYPFKIDYYLSKHRGVSRMRNQCLDASTADYVMFCDADDMFLSNCGLYLIFQNIDNKKFDILVSTFSEEINRNGKFEYHNHVNDATFVHGKVYRRQYLYDNKIFWNNRLTIHEDSYFNYLSRVCTTEDKIAYCNDVFYLWKWRKDSICREDKDYILKTLGNMVDSTDDLVEELIKRSKLDKASFIASNFIYNVYYDMNKDEWNDPKNQHYIDKFVEKFRLFYKKYASVAKLTPEKQRNDLLLKIKNNKFKEGVIFEKFTFAEWLTKYNFN